MQWRSTLATTTLAAVLAGYLLVAWQNHDEFAQLTAPVELGYYLKQATVIETGADGNTRLKLQAANITQNLKNDSINLQQVVVNYQSEDMTPWLLTADRGELPANSKQLHFYGNVFIKSQDASLQRPEIRTSELLIDTEKYLASTNAQVVFMMDEHQLSSIGLKYDLKRQRLQLNSQVHGLFQNQEINE